MEENKVVEFCNKVFIKNSLFKEYAVKFVCDVSILLNLNTVGEIFKFFLVDGDINKLETYDKYNILKDKHLAMVRFFNIPDDIRLDIYKYIQKSFIDYLNDEKNNENSLNKFKNELSYYNNDILTTEGRKAYFSGFLKRNVFTNDNEYDIFAIDFISTFAANYYSEKNFIEISILSYFLPKGDVNDINSYNNFDICKNSGDLPIRQFLNLDVSSKVRWLYYFQDNIEKYFIKLKINNYTYLNNLDKLYMYIDENLANCLGDKFELFLKKIKNVFNQNFLFINNWYEMIVKNYENIFDEFKNLFNDNTIIFQLPLYTGLSGLKVFFNALLMGDLSEGITKNDTDVLALQAIVEVVVITNSTNPNFGKNVYKNFMIDGNLDNINTYFDWFIYNNDIYPTFQNIFLMPENQRILVFKAIVRIAAELYKKAVSPKQRIINALKNNLVNIEMTDPYWDIVSLNFMASCIVYELEDLYINKTNRDMMKYFLADGKDDNINSYKKYEHFKIYQDEDINAVLTLNDKAKLSVFKHINNIAIKFLMNK